MDGAQPTERPLPVMHVLGIKNAGKSHREWQAPATAPLAAKTVSR